MLTCNMNVFLMANCLNPNLQNERIYRASIYKDKFSQEEE